MATFLLKILDVSNRLKMDGTKEKNNSKNLNCTSSKQNDYFVQLMIMHIARHRETININQTFVQLYFKRVVCNCLYHIANPSNTHFNLLRCDSLSVSAHTI